MGARGKVYTRPKPSHDMERRQPPKLCRPGRVKCKLEFTAVANMSTRVVPKAENSLSKVSWGSPHSVGLGLFSQDRASAVTFLAPGRWVGMSRIPNWSRRWNSSSILLNNDTEWVPPCLHIWATAILLSGWAGPTGELLDGWLLVPASWCADWSPSETIVQRDDNLVNWIPSLLGMHQWKRTGWVPVDAEELPWEHPVCGTNAGEKGILYPVVMECPRIACVGPNVTWSRIGETWAAGVHDG